MEILKKILVILLVLPSFYGMTQNGFYKKYTAGSFVKGNGITQLPDSSYAITGVGGDFDGASGQAYLMIVDSLGNYLWSQNYGSDTTDEVGVRVMHKEGEGFYIAGYSSETDDGNFNFMLLKTDELGNLLWQKNYGTANWEILHDAMLLDNQIILVGETDGLTTQQKDMYMVFTDLNGDTLWTKTIASPVNDIAYAVDTISSSELLIGGQKGDNNFEKGVLISCSLTGSINWSKFDNTRLIPFIKDVIVYENEIYACGAYYNSDTTIYDIWYGQYDLNGNYLDHVQGDFVYSTNTWIPAMATIDDWDYSLFIAVEFDGPEASPEPYPGGLDVQIIRFSRLMFYWGPSYNYSAYNDDFINQIIPTNDGGIAFIGTSSDNGKDLTAGTRGMLGKIGRNLVDPYVDDNDIEEFSILSVYSESPKKSLKIYPNPTSDIIHLPSEVIGLTYEIHSIQGEIVLKGESKNILSLEGLTQGVYFLKIMGKDSVWTAKISKR
ncbi:MAG: T9SS type A sorting domain-containing protein [Brumimicrobium sp.]|nr:T9SS type A sorting domain-containing protein [Brumimicrobium sp.]